MNGRKKAPTKFEDKKIDASIDTCCWITCLPFTFGAIPFKTIIYLDSEEVTKTDHYICGQSVSKRPYGELGSVEQSNCCCFWAARSSFGDIQPGCGCQKTKVKDLVEDLKARQKGRGDTGQIQRSEETLERLDHMEAKIDLILNAMDLEAPPRPMAMEER